MKKRTEIQQDLKRGFGSAPTGIKKLVKWLAVGFVAYVAVRFVCAFIGGCCRWFGWFAAHVGRFGSGGPPYPYRVAHPLDIPFPLRVCAFAHSYLRDTLTKY